MVAKINNGVSLFGALTYNIDKVQKGNAYVICNNKIIQNISNKQNLDLSLAMRSFEPYLSLNDRIKKPVIHISLNPDPKDCLTDQEYKKIAEDYLEKMGFKDQPYIIYKHQDIDRHHIHIVTVRVSDQGEKISDAHEHYRSMRACRELENKYNLQPAIGKHTEFSEGFIKKIDYQEGDLKRQISNTLRSLCDIYTFHSFGEYNALLSCYNIHAKLISGERFGEKYNGIVYAATDNNGNIISNPFKSSLFGKRLGFCGLEKIMKRSSEKLKQSDYREKIKPVIYNTIRNSSSKTDFINKLKTNGIDTIFRENESGRIYGVTFIDHNNKIVINGSRLGKELSANVFNHLFNQQTNIPSNIPQSNISSEIKSPLTHNIFEHTFSPFNSGITGEDQEEKKFEYEIKKKKRKRKKGRQL